MPDNAVEDKFDYNAFNKLIDTNDSDALKSTMDQTESIDPNQHAKILDLSKQSNIPKFAIKADVDKVENSVKKSEFNYDAFNTNNPKTANFLKNFDNAAIAQDDLQILSDIELTLNKPVGGFFDNIAPALKQGTFQTIKGLGRGLEVDAINTERVSQEPFRAALIESANQNVTLSPEEISKLPNEEGQLLPSKNVYLEALTNKRNQWVEEQFDKTPDTFEKFSLPFIKTPAKFLRDAGQSMTLFAEKTLKENPEWQRNPELLNKPWTELITDSRTRTAFLARSIGENVPNLIAAIGVTGTTALITKNPAVATEVGLLFTHTLEAGFSFDELIKLTGDEQSAAETANAVGIVNSLLETIPIGGLLSKTPGLRNIFSRQVVRKLAARPLWRKALVDGVKQASSEGVTEGLQEVVGNIGKSFYKDNQDLFEGVTESMFIGSLLGGGISVINTTASSIVDRTENIKSEEEEKKSKGDIEQDKINEINDKAEKSELRKRSVETFKQFVNEADGDNNTTVFVDGAQTALYLQTFTTEEIEADRALTLLDQQAREASQLGTDIQIPVSDFAADIAGSDTYAELRDSMTMSDESISPFRQDQVNKETETYISKLIAEAETTSTEYVEAQNIYTQVRSQLIDTGVITPANASIMAQIIPAWATAQASRQGKTIQEVYSNSGLVIEGPQTGEKTRLEGELFNQINKDDATALNSIFDQFDDTGELTQEDVVNEVESFIEDSNNDFTELSNAISDYRKEQQDDADLGGRGDLDAAGDAFNNVLLNTTEQLSKPQNELTNVEQRVTKQIDSENVARERRKLKGSNARAFFDNMNREELINQLLKHDLTNIKGRRAFQIDVQDAPVIGSIDADSLKWINDNLSPEHGDTLLQAVADSLENETENAYHISGDEFYVLGETQDEVQDTINKAIEKLSTAVITATKPDGTVITLNGLNITYGIGETKDDADNTLKQEKVRREETGERASRGEQPLGSIIRSAEGFDPEGDVSEVREDPVDSVQGDLFGGTLNEAGQYTETPGDVQPSDKVQNRAIITGREIIKQVEVGFDKLDSIAKVALATISLSNSPQEKFWAITLDKNDKPLEILSHTTGVKDAASVDPAAVAGWAVSVEDATQVYFSHNHPSDTVVLSTADKTISKTLGNILEGSGVEPKGIMAVSPTEYTHDSGESGFIPVAETSSKIELVERTLKRLPTKNRIVIASPEEAKTVIENMSQGEEGVMLLNNNHVPVGFLPFNFKKDGGELRGGKLATLLKAVESTNASAIMLNVSELGANEQNVANMLNASGMRILDAFVDGVSAEEKGLNITTGKTFKQENRGYYDPANNVIRLTEAADLSTFLHEFAHFMYEMETRADTELLQDINKWYKRNAENVAKEATTYVDGEFDILKQGERTSDSKITITSEDVIEYIDNGTTSNSDKDSAIRRALHEQFARGFETYLMEGKAPSIELRNAFRAFARWLSRIYQFLRGGLDVNVDSDMNQVFDRLLATEEQIQAAEARSRIEPMFTDAAMAGMTDDEFSKYKAKEEKVKDVQDETLRNKLIKQFTRQTESWWNEQKQDIIDEELENLKQQQVYLTSERLKRPVNKKQFDNDIAELDKELTAISNEIKQINKKNDTIGKFIARNGGLNRESMLSEGVDPDHFKDKAKVFGKPLFPRKGGMTANDLAEKLNQEDFRGGELSANDALEVVFDVLSDDTAFIDPDVTAEVGILSRNADDIEIQKNDIEEQSSQNNLKLDHATVKQMMGERKVDKLGRKSTVIPPKLNGMTAKGQQGVHPDEAASFFGYNSGSEMLNDLVTAPPINQQADENAEARMVNLHGDILNDGTIEQEADDAIRNEERGELILLELKTLAKGTNAPVIKRNTIKELAKTNIDKLSFREVHPGKYRKAEIRAAQESAVMLAAGNKEDAATAKFKQVMNYYLGIAATDAKNETTKIVDTMSRYSKKKVREEIMKAEGGYWDQIVKILNRFEFRKSATLKQVESINTWMKTRNEESGGALVLSNVVLNESYVTHWKNIPFTDLQGVNYAVKNIEHVARYSNKMQGMQDEIDFNLLKSQWIENIKLQDAKFKSKSSRSRIDDSRKATLLEHTQRWNSQLTKIPFLASWLDGGERAGISHDILIQPMTDALDAKMKLLDEVAKPVLDAIKKRSKKDIARHALKIFIPEIDDTLSGDQVLAVALNTGNQGNLKKMLLGESWADPDVEIEIIFDNPKLQAVLSHMSKSDWELVQIIWDQMEKLYPQLAEIHQRTTGLTPPKVEATSLEVNIDGDIIKLKGGYYPVKYSDKRSHKAEKNAEKRDAETESMFNNTASIQASVNTSATNERTGFYDRILLSLDVVPEHFNETIHYITHHDAVRQTNRLIQSPDVADAITEIMGESEYKELKPWLNDIAKDGRQQPVKTFIDEAFHRLRFGTTLGVMGFKASTGIMQLFGIMTTSSELGIGPTIKGVTTVVGRSWYMKAVRKVLGSTDNMQSGWDFAAERSKVLPHRVKTMDREIRNAMNRLSKKTGALATVQEVSMKHIALIQTYMIDLPTWHSAYEKHLSENNDEAKAVRFADLTVENTQGSGATKDMSRILRNQSKILTTFTMFMTFFSSLGNLTRDLVRGSRSGQYSLSSTAAKIMFLFILPVFFEMLMRGSPEDEDDDERMNKFMVNVALYPLQSVPFIRDVASGALSDFGYNSSPVASMLERGIESGSALVGNILTDEEITKAQIKNTSKLIGAALGIPGVSQMWSTGEHLYDVIEEGEELTTRELLFGPRR